MNENIAPGVYLLDIDLECDKAKQEFQRMGFSDGEKQDFQRFTPQALSVTPLWLVWHGTVHSGNVLLKSEEELIPLGISSDTELPIRKLSEVVREYDEKRQVQQETKVPEHGTEVYRKDTEEKDYSLERLCRYERTAEKCMAAVEQDGWELAHVPEEVKTPEMCRIALDNSADLAYENVELLRHVPFPEVCLEYIRANNGGGDVELPEVVSSLAPGVINDKIADYAVEQDGRCLGALPVHLQTVERAETAVKKAGTIALASDNVRAGLKTEAMYRKCAEHSWMSFALLPKAERSPEICLLADKLYPEEMAKRPDLIPESVKNGCNVYSLGKLMEQATGEKFSFGQIKEFYDGKPMAVKRMEIPEGILINREVTFDKQNEKFRFAPLREREEQTQGMKQKEEHKLPQSQGEAHTQGRERKKGLKL